MLQIFDQNKHLMWCLSHIYDSDDKYIPQRKYVTDRDQGLNIASYSTSSLVPIPP